MSLVDSVIFSGKLQEQALSGKREASETAFEAGSQQ